MSFAWWGPLPKRPGWVEGQNVRSRRLRIDEVYVESKENLDSDYVCSVNLLVGSIDSNFREFFAREGKDITV